MKKFIITICLVLSSIATVNACNKLFYYVSTVNYTDSIIKTIHKDSTLEHSKIVDFAYVKGEYGVYPYVKLENGKIMPSPEPVIGRIESEKNIIGKDYYYFSYNSTLTYDTIYVFTPDKNKIKKTKNITSIYISDIYNYGDIFCYLTISDGRHTKKCYIDYYFFLSLNIKKFERLSTYELEQICEHSYHNGKSMKKYIVQYLN